MEVKGTAVEIIRRYVQQMFQDKGVQRWLDALPYSSRRIVEGVVLPSTLYPVHEALVVPTQAVCEVFYQGRMDGAWELGRYSADVALNGVYKFLVRVAPPAMVLQKATVLTNYYRPMKLEIIKKSDNHHTLCISEMDEPSLIIDNRIAGWAQRGLEICGVKNFTVKIVSSAKDVNTRTEIDVRW